MFIFYTLNRFQNYYLYSCIPVATVREKKNIIQMTIYQTYVLAPYYNNEKKINLYL